MSRPYRILHVIDSLDLGGAQIVLLNLLKYADRERFQSEVVALHGRGVFWPVIKATGCRMWSMSWHHYFPSYAPGLAALMLAKRYDVVHCHLLASNVIAKPLAALCGVPVRINHDHCNDKLADPRRWALPADTWANRYATHVIAVSESARHFVQEHEHVPAPRTTTIHNGIDCTAYRPRPTQHLAARQRFGIPEDAFVIGGIGRLTHQKNFAMFIEIAKAVLQYHPEAYFVIAGTGELRAGLEQQAARLGVEDRVKFLGFVGDMSALYPALDLLLLTSRYEGLPITILEAMACGVPIVASKLDGIAEVLNDGRSASLCPHTEAGLFVRRINEMITMPERRQAFAEAALAKVREEYSAERMTRAVEAIYLRHLK